MECPQSSIRTDACPHDSRNMMPTDLEVGGNTDLSSERVASSIPKSDMNEQGGTWLYPSPQMFYNAMSRKGHSPKQEDMDVIVTIHNIVNEQSWQAVLKWEKYYHPDTTPKLKRFLGRPDSLSPRAWFRTFFLGYARPFDRHDWFIERDGGQEVRYVIDYYSGAKNDSGPSFHIDARPALDNLDSLYVRSHFTCNKFFNSLKQYIEGEK